MSIGSVLQNFLVKINYVQSGKTQVQNDTKELGSVLIGLSTLAAAAAVQVGQVTLKYASGMNAVYLSAQRIGKASVTEMVAMGKAAKDLGSSVESMMGSLHGISQFKMKYGSAATSVLKLLSPDIKTTDDSATVLNKATESYIKRTKGMSTTQRADFFAQHVNPALEEIGIGAEDRMTMARNPEEFLARKSGHVARQGSDFNKAAETANKTELAKTYLGSSIESAQASAMTPVMETATVTMQGLDKTIQNLDSTFRNVLGISATYLPVITSVATAILGAHALRYGARMLQGGRHNRGGRWSRPGGGRVPGRGGNIPRGGSLAGRVGRRALRGGVRGGVAGLGLLAAQSIIPEDSLAGKIVNSNTAKFAALGMMLGPWGAAIGAVAGATKDTYDFFNKPGNEPKVNSPETNKAAEDLYKQADTEDNVFSLQRRIVDNSDLTLKVLMESNETLTSIYDMFQEYYNGSGQSKGLGSGNSDVGSGTTPANVNVSGTEKERASVIGSKLKALGYTDAQAAGIMGNMHAESTLNPFASNDIGGGHYGLIQWGKTRQKDYAKLFGHTMQSVKDQDQAIDEQLKFIRHEQETTEKASLAAMKRGADDAAEQARIFYATNERAGAHDTSLSKRMGAANAFSNTNANIPYKSAEATANGSATAETQAYLEYLNSTMHNDIKQVTAVNDQYHKGKKSLHNKGQAFDFTLKNPGASAEIAERIRADMKARGINGKVIDEYRNPSANATGGHIHVSVLSGPIVDRTQPVQVATQTPIGSSLHSGDPFATADSALAYKQQKQSTTINIHGVNDPERAAKRATEILAKNERTRARNVQGAFR